MRPIRAPSRSGIPLALVEDRKSLALGIVEAHRAAEPPPASARNRIADALAQADAPISLAAIRDACRMRTQAISVALGQLVAEGRVLKTSAGYALS